MMRNTLLALFVFAGTAFATESYSQTMKVTVVADNVSTGKVISEIEKQTDYLFVYNVNEVNLKRNVKVNAQNKSVAEVLNKVFEGTDIYYAMEGKNIMLMSKAKDGEAAQQANKVTGIVKDANGEPVIGANVMVKGQSIGTITDIDGRFVLDAPKDAVLQITYIGYVSQEVKVSGKKELNIMLKEDTETLDEVVVVGYGVQKKSDVTGAALRVGEKELKARPVNNALEALQGKAAGVDITSSERPGTMGEISIRGVRSLTASNSPLYVVDGIPLMSGGIDYLNPSDIESIDILKDASATAIYGSRGANGVVLVTTKQGKSGKMTLNYSGAVTAENLQDNIEMMDSEEYIDFRRWAYYYSNPVVYPRADQPTKENDYKIFNGAVDPYAWANIEKGWENGTWDGSKVITTDWINMVKQTGITHQHTLSGSGGSEKMKGYFSFGYLNNKGTIKGQGYTRYTAKVAFDATPLKWFSLGGNINATYSIQEYGQSGTGANINAANSDLYYSARTQFPYAVPYDFEGNLIETPGGDPGVLNIVNEWEYSQDQRITLRTLGSFYAQVDFGKIYSKLDGLRYRMNFGPDFSNYRQGVYLDSKSVTRLGSSYAALNRSQDLSYTLDNLLFYNKNIQKHSFGLTMLQSMTKYINEGMGLSATNIPYSSQKWDALTNTNVPLLDSWNSSLTKRQLLSYMARLNYSYAEKYLFTVSGRWDGASQLSEGNKWSFFPSAALGWRIEQEPFMTGLSDVISQLKLRLGVGVTGNSAINPYVTKGALGSLYYPTGSTLISGTSPSSTMANQDLGWERTLQYNLGLDYSLLRGRISGTIDFYKSKTTDLLMLMSIPTVTGYNNTYANIGETKNLGVDFTLNTVNIDSHNFRWTTDFSASYNKDEIVSLSNGKEDDINNKWFIGESIGVIYGYQSAGLWKEEDAEEMAKFNANGHNFKAGNVRPVDQNGDHKIDANNDRVIVGNTRPRWTLGMTNTLSFKGLEFSVFMFGRLGYYYACGGESEVGRFSQRKINYYNENNKNAEYQMPIYTTSIGDQYYESIDYRKASFIKVRNISLGYVLPKKILSKMGLSYLKIYGQIVNPGMLCSQIDFLDMDVRRSTWNRAFTFGLDITF